MRHFLVADIRISQSSPFESSLLELSHLFSPFKWRILIRMMSKTLLKIVAYNRRGPRESVRNLEDLYGNPSNFEQIFWVPGGPTIGRATIFQNV